MTTIITPRLLLRPHEPADAEALLRGVGNLNVSQWAARIPHPYALADAEAFLALESDTMFRRAIVLRHDPGQLIGGIGYEWKAEETPEIGYWIAEPFWGRGYAAEAARAIVDHAFDAGGQDALAASYQLGNEASRRILDGLGFIAIGEGESFSRARNAQTRVMHLRQEQKGRRA